MGLTIKDTLSVFVCIFLTTKLDCQQTQKTDNLLIYQPKYIMHVKMSIALLLDWQNVKTDGTGLLFLSTESSKY